MKTIFAIGGGEINVFETLSIDEAIVEAARAATGKLNPKVLFIPTASQESESYIEAFKKLYEEQLECEMDVLLMLEGSLTEAEAREKILSSDIIYVGGGNTRMMMSEWRKNGIDRLMIEAYEKGVIMSGLSAGAICWFAAGQTDTQIYEAGDARNYMTVEGMGVIKAILCPHHEEHTRAEDFEKRIKAYGAGIALDNNCAIELRDDRFRIHRSIPTAKGYCLKYQNGVLSKKELVNEDAYMPLDQLWVLNR